MISPLTENDLLVVKDHGNAVFANPSRVRSRRKHRFCEKTKSISTNFSFEKKKIGDGDVRYGVAERDLYIQIRCIYKKKIMNGNITCNNIACNYGF